MSELRNHPRKLTPNSATFTRTGQSSPFVSSKRRLRRMPTACWLCNLVWTIPVEIVQIYIAISVAWNPRAGEVVRELTNRSPGLTPSGRVDAVRGGSSFVAAHWGDQAPDAVGDGCSGNFGLRRRHVGPLNDGNSDWTQSKDRYKALTLMRSAAKSTASWRVRFITAPLAAQ